MKMQLRHLLAALVLVVSSGATFADAMLMGRIPMRAELVFEYVKSSIQEHGYSIAHLQLCDGGMTDFGYKTDFYQVVFFGKVEEVRMISERFPELVSYVPLKMAVIAENDETLLTVLNPEALVPYFTDTEMQVQLGRWHSDLQSIFEDVRRAVGKRIAGTN